MAPAPPTLNPEAPQYTPLSDAQPQLTLLSLTPTATPPFIPTFFPTPSLPFPYPSNLCTIHLQSFNAITFLTYQHYPPTNLLPLPRPPPPQENIPLPPPLPTEPFLLPRVVTTEKRYLPKRHATKSGKARGSKRGGDSGKKWIKKGGGTVYEEERARERERWGFVKKYQSIPLQSDEDKTTVMIKNIPNQFTPGMLLDFMDKHCMLENQKAKEGSSDGFADDEKMPTLTAYDFLYLPMDFRTKLNKGYAFVNFSEPEAAWRFFNAYDGKKWDFNRSSKIRKIVRARIQGKEALVQHFQESNFDCESDEFLPVSFCPPRDGSGQTVKLAVVGNRVKKMSFLCTLKVCT